jgi:hypothetical protein
VLAGLTKILLVVAPVLQLYVLAPLDEIVAELPAQMAVGVTTGASVGDGVIVMEIMAELVQPDALAPITV